MVKNFLQVIGFVASNSHLQEVLVSFVYIYTHVLYRFLLPPSSCLAFLFCICCNQKWQGKSAFTHRQALFGNYHRSDFNSTPASDLLSTFQLLALVQAPGNNELARIHIKYKKKNISTLLL